MNKSKQSTRRLVVGAGLILSTLMGGAALAQSGGPVRAQQSQDTIVVSSTFDAADANPADGICAALVESVKRCTLRAAIQTANSRNDPTKATTIKLAAGTYPLTVSGANEDAAAMGDLDIRVPMTIVGPQLTKSRAVITAAGLGDRVFDIHNPFGSQLMSVSLQWLTIRDGSGVSFGGGIQAARYVKLSIGTSEVTNNRAVMGGGGIWASEQTRIDFSSVDHNATTGGYTPLHGGGGIFTTGTLDLNGSVVAHNQSARRGGGIFAADTGTIATAYVSLTASAVLSNEAMADGGGIYSATNGVALVNTTLSGNQANRGGGLFLDTRLVAGTPAAFRAFRQATIAGNRSNSGGAGMDAAASLGSARSLDATNSVFDNNLTVGQPANCTASVTFDPITYGNLSSDGRCLFPAAHNRNSTPAMLGPLVNFEKTWWGHEPLPGSPLIDTGEPIECASKDGRFAPRPYGPGCDVGAIEYIPGLSPTPTPTPTPPVTPIATPTTPATPIVRTPTPKPLTPTTGPGPLPPTPTPAES